MAKKTRIQKKFLKLRQRDSKQRNQNYPNTWPDYDYVKLFEWETKTINNE